MYALRSETYQPECGHNVTSDPETKSSLKGIPHIPETILAGIFSLALDFFPSDDIQKFSIHQDLGHLNRDYRPLLSLSSVCQEWRYTAIHCASLWNIIGVSLPFKLNQLLFERSKSAPLIVDLAGPGPRPKYFDDILGDWVFEIREQTGFHKGVENRALLQLVRKNINRVAVLAVQNDPFIIEKIFPNFPIHSIRTVYLSRPEVKFGSSASSVEASSLLPGLRSLCICDQAIPTHSWGTQFLQNLRRLYYNDAYGIHSTFDGLLSVLSQCKQLEELSLLKLNFEPDVPPMNVHPLSRDANNSCIELPLLRIYEERGTENSISSYNFMQHIEAPSLRKYYASMYGDFGEGKIPPVASSIIPNNLRPPFVTKSFEFEFPLYRTLSAECKGNNAGDDEVFSYYFDDSFVAEYDNYAYGEESLLPLLERIVDLWGLTNIEVLSINLKFVYSHPVVGNNHASGHLCADLIIVFHYFASLRSLTIKCCKDERCGGVDWVLEAMSSMDREQEITKQDLLPTLVELSLQNLAFQWNSVPGDETGFDALCRLLRSRHRRDNKLSKLNIISCTGFTQEMANALESEELVGSLVIEPS